MRWRCVPVVLLTFPGVASVAHAVPSEWEHVRSDDGIIVHRREHPGYPLHEFRGRGTVDVSLPAVLGVIQDLPRHVEWVERCIEARELQRIPGSAANGNTRLDDRIVYHRTEATWPVSDRDAVVRSHVTVDPANREVLIRFSSVASRKVAARDGVVRMPFLRGHWRLRAQGAHTFVEYQVHADPGGSLPNWVINFVSKALPYKTIVRLREQVRRRQYPEVERALMADPAFYEVATGRPLAPAAAPGAGAPAAP